MKIERVIQLAGLMERGNVLPEELAIELLSELDGMIQSDIMLHAPEEIVRYDSTQQELLLRPPHDKLYVHYLVMMIRNQQQEYEGYQNSQASVDEKLKTFRRWYIHHYRPADTNSRSYTGGTSGDGFGFAYLSAYGIAVKHGYQGTEEAWLESLHGEKGDPGEAARMRYDAERDMIQWGVGEEWHDLYTMAEVLAPLYEKLEEMTARAETAAAGAEDAAGTAVAAAEEASSDAALAQQAREAAQTAAATAADAAENAAGSATAAAESAHGATTQAERADTAAAAADGYARTAQEAAAAAANDRACTEQNLESAEEAAVAAQGSADRAEQAYTEAERMAARAETARTDAQAAADEARAAAEEAKGAGGSGGGGSIIVDEDGYLTTTSGGFDIDEDGYIIL